ncbi:ATP-dependent protease subunit HslV [Myxococcota bacterium]|nr:ATP-dependent protease subunit HslV [Myxococcota bacterium]
MFHGTTIVAVKKDGKTAIAGDGQVSLQNTIVKHTARKVRRIYNDKVICGFAGSTADALTLQEKFEGRLKDFNGNLTRAAVELAKEWRTDKYLRRLEALLLVADHERVYLISGNGDVLEPDEGVHAIGSGGPYALAAARAMLRHTNLSAPEIARNAIQIAAEICVFTNNDIVMEQI